MSGALEKFLEITKCELEAVFDSIKSDTFDRVTDLILDAQSRNITDYI